MESSFGFSDCLIKLSSLANKAGRISSYFLQIQAISGGGGSEESVRDEKIKLEMGEGKENTRGLERLFG